MNPLCLRERCVTTLKEGEVVRKLCCSMRCYHCSCFWNDLSLLKHCIECGKNLTIQDFTKTIFNSNSQLAENEKQQLPKLSFLQEQIHQMSAKLEKLLVKVEQGESRQKELEASEKSYDIAQILRENLNAFEEEFENVLKTKAFEKQTNKGGSEETNLLEKITTLEEKFNQLPLLVEEETRKLSALFFDKERFQNSSILPVEDTLENELKDAVLVEPLIRKKNSQNMANHSKTHEELCNGNAKNCVECIKLREKVDVLEEKLKEAYLELGKEIRKSTELTVDKIKLQSMLDHSEFVKPQNPDSH